MPVKKKGWKETKDLNQLGEDTVALKIARAEGSDVEKVKVRLKKAKEEYLKKRRN